jgi:peptidoglycan hydrolase-like protein with peptidoglycan-binding domain
MVAALALGDPAQLRKVAGELRAHGFTKDAEKLEAEATKIEKAKASGSSSSSSGPGVFPGTSAGPETNPKQLTAAAVARAPSDATKVRPFQTQEGLAADGKYGPKTAIALIKYGFVPPTPLYWPSDGGAARAAYIAALKTKAAEDDVRREEWLQAATRAAAPSSTPSSSSSSASSSSSSTPATIPTLRLNAKGPNVVFLRRLLNQNGAAIPMTDVFDRALLATVRDFQSKRRDPQTGKPLAVDGVVGPATWRALGAFN